VSTDNEMHEPVFPNGTAICEVEIDPDTGAMVISRYVSIDDVGRCINPLIVHGQTHGAIAQGVARRCRAGLSRRRFRPAADRLADGLRHAACRPRCRHSTPGSPRCCRRPIRSASKAGGEGAPRRRPRPSSPPCSMPCGNSACAPGHAVTPYAIWTAIQQNQGRQELALSRP